MVKRVLLILVLTIPVSGVEVFFHLGIQNDDLVRSSACEGCLSCIATAMHQYHDKYGHFPPAHLEDASGKPVHSWRVLLLEFLEPDLYAAYRFDEPWDGPNNRKLEPRMPNYFSCPADPESKSRWRTNYFVVVGERTVFPGSKTIRIQDIERPRDSTILLVEAIGQDIHWMEPRDLLFDSMSFTINDKSRPGPSSRHRAGPFVCMADVTKRRLTDFSQEMFKEMLLIKPRENNE